MFQPLNKNSGINVKCWTIKRLFVYYNKSESGGWSHQKDETERETHLFSISKIEKYFVWSIKPAKAIHIILGDHSLFLSILKGEKDV